MEGCSLYILLSNKNKNQVSSDSSQIRRRKPEGIWGKPHANSGSLEQTDGHEQQLQLTGKANLFILSHEPHVCVCRLDLAVKKGNGSM